MRAKTRWFDLDHARLVPASLLAGRTRRSARDWTVDILLFLASLAGGFLVLGISIGEDGLRLSSRGWLFELVSGVGGSLLLWARRRWPVTVCLLTSIVSIKGTWIGVAAMIALCTVAVHRPAGLALVLSAIGAGTGIAYYLLNDVNSAFPGNVAVVVALTVAVLALGLFVRARRQLVLSLREQAERADAEARAAERARIAREMHDVLAHRVSLIALHAGGLEVRPDLPQEDVQRTAGLIRVTARQALEELGGVIGVLRDGTDGPAPQAPQPTLHGVRRLVEQSRGAGVPVDLDLRVEAPDEAPPVPARAVYRVVQEALTNVHKHAEGAGAEVTVVGGPGVGLRVTVRNRLPAEPAAPALPGSGSGLLGLAERVQLAGGTLSHGPEDGYFVVDAELGWPE